MDTLDGVTIPLAASHSMHRIIAWLIALWTARVLLRARGREGRKGSRDTVSEHLAHARAHLEAARFDPHRLEQLRRQSLLGLLEAEGVRVAGVETLDSEALRKIVDRHFERTT